MTEMSTTAFILVILSAALHAYWNFVAKKQARNPAVLYLGLGFALLVLLLPAMVVFAGWDDVWRALPYMVATGALHAAYYALLFKGYAHNDLSSLYPLARGISILGVAAISILFFHASIPALGLGALLAILCGVVLLGFHKGSTSLRVLKADALAKLLPLLIGASIVSYTLIDNEGVKRVHPILYATGLTLFALIFMLPLQLRKRGSLGEAWRKYKKPSLIVGIGSIGTYLIILFVYQLTQLSFVVALREVSIAIGAIIGVVVLKERWNIAKIAAVSCIVLGAILLRLV